jgi:single-strand selective monofunctional uracil DNA glycosylase
MTPSLSPKRTATAPVSSKQTALVNAAKRLSNLVDAMAFAPPVTHVYNPLQYAWKSHREYLSRCSMESTRSLFLGMNPGPWGMAQTGVPFGQVDAVRDWLRISSPVDRPTKEHPKRPIDGFECRRSEVSGERLWGLFKHRFETPEKMFQEQFIVNYCPLVFMEASAKNRTPDKLSSQEMKLLQSACDEHLKVIIDLLRPKFLVGVGAYAEKCFARVTGAMDADIIHGTSIVRILHPSPASPAANRNWAEVVTGQLISAGVWLESTDQR